MDMTTGRERQVTRFTRGNEGVFAQTWLPDNRHLVVSYVPFPRQQAAADLGILDIDDGGHQAADDDRPGRPRIAQRVG